MRSEDGSGAMSDPAIPFSDPGAVAHYAEGPPRLVPGFADLHRMARLLLHERTPPEGRVLVLGAGGGLELEAFADAEPGWRFDGVDPSGPMLALARARLTAHLPRIALHEGTIAAAPPGPFDAATCLLTLHFLTPAERGVTLREVHRRLKPGAPLVVAHLSIPGEEAARELWLARYAAFAVSSGLDPDRAAQARAAIGSQLPILAPEQDEAMLREAGFSDVGLFYAAFTFRGWVAYA